MRPLQTQQANVTFCFQSLTAGVSITCLSLPPLHPLSPAWVRREVEPAAVGISSVRKQPAARKHALTFGWLLPKLSRRINVSHRRTAADPPAAGRSAGTGARKNRLRTLPSPCESRLHHLNRKWCWEFRWDHLYYLCAVKHSDLYVVIHRFSINKSLFVRSALYSSDDTNSLGFSGDIYCPIVAKMFQRLERTNTWIFVCTKTAAFKDWRWLVGMRHDNTLKNTV